MLFLSVEVLREAWARSPDQVATLLNEFSHSEAPRIVEVGTRLEALVQQPGQANPTALTDSYRILSEGMFRPFGLAVHRATQIMRGEQPEATRLRLADLQARLQSDGTELTGLLACGLDRPIRNAAAHENVLQDAFGGVSVVDDLGNLNPLDLDELAMGLGALHTMLRAVDVGLGFALWIFEPNPPTRQIPGFGALVDPDWLRAQTREQLRMFASLSFLRVSDGEVVEATVSAEVATLVVDATAPIDKLRYVAYKLEAHLPSPVSRVVIALEDGTILFDEDIIRLSPLTRPFLLGPAEEKT
jgi:hypothetical protein